MSTSEQEESIQCTVNKVFVFKIPIAQNSTGHQAKEWPKQPIWTGRLRVVTRNQNVVVLLEHIDKEGLFASCPVTSDRSVEPVIDSSRYFVLKLDDGKGRHAFIGLGFNSREEAFEFKVSLQEAEKLKSGKEKAEQYLSSLPSLQLGLPEGARITVNLPNKPKSKEKEGSSGVNSVGPVDHNKPFALAPPPPSGKRRQANSKKTEKKTQDVLGFDSPEPASQVEDNDEEDFWDANHGSANNNNNNNSNNNKPNQGDDWTPF